MQEIAATTEKMAAPPANKLSQRPGPPPLRIHHLFAVTTVTAAFFTLQKWLLPAGDVDTAGIFVSGYGILRAISVSLAMTVLGFAIVWRRAGLAFFHCPGHWLLLFEGLPLLYYITLAWLALRRLSEGNSYNQLPFHVYFLSIFICMLALTILSVRKGADSRWWRAYFIFQGCVFFAIPVAALVGLSGQHFVDLYSCGLLCVLIASLMADRLSHRSRDWPHWIGVGVMSLTIITTMAKTFL